MAKLTAEERANKLAAQVLAGEPAQVVEVGGIRYALYWLEEGQARKLGGLGSTGWVGQGLGAKLWWCSFIGGQDYLAEELPS